MQPATQPSGALARPFLCAAISHPFPIPLIRHFNPRRPGAGRTAAGLLAGLLLALPGLAQTAAPAWNLATSGNPSQASTGHTFVTATAVDARGNVFLTGSFTNTIAFGSIQLTSAGNTDLFLAKWDATTQAFTWATRGGGTGFDAGNGLAVSGTSVYVTGSFASAAATTLAGQALPGAGGTDVFVAKYVDTSTGNTPATSSFAPGWVATGGSPGNDAGYGVAVSGPGVYVTGDFTGVANTSFAGQALTGAGGVDVFVAKYLDTSTGSTPATSSFANGWATSGGGPGADDGYGLAISGQQVYVGGLVGAPATFGSLTFGAASGYSDGFLGRLPDASLLATSAAAPASAGLSLSPNPAAYGAATLRGAPFGALVQVLDALGRVAATTTAGASGRATLGGLAPGLYLVRAGTEVLRLAVE